jgi:tRNA A-37 threonylcarbamoyl transferase component Bud32
MGSTTRPSEAEGAATGQGGGRAWVERELRGAAREPRDLLRDILAARPATALRALAGRATFRWPADPAVVVKRYSTPDWRDLVHDLLRGRARSVAQREADNLRELALAGIAVPEAYGWCDGGALSGPSALWMQHLEHSSSLAEACERDADAARRFLPELAGFVARLHAGGWYHRDLYLGHWLVAPAGLFLVDVGRARRERSPRTRWFVKDLAALLHSCPPSVSAQARLRFLVLYLDARGIASHDDRRSFARAVLAKAARIAAHVPRWRDPVTGQ